MKELQSSWNTLANFIKNRNSLQIGSINQICCLIFKQAYLVQDFSFIDSIIKFIDNISSFCKKKPQSLGEALSLIALQAIVFNLYAKTKPNDHIKINNSFYMSMSMSQMSVEISQQSNINQDRDSKKINLLILQVASSKLIFQKIKVILERNANKELNNRYGENLIQTLDYILNKEKFSKEKFITNKSLISSYQNKHKIQIDIPKINDIIFSNQLNRIVNLLTQSNQEVYYSLIRIYFAGKNQKNRIKYEKKHFANIKYMASDMLYNINRYYIDSLDSKAQLFEESKNPLYKIIKLYICELFMPTLVDFNQLVLRLSKRDDSNSYIFYKNNQELIIHELGSFIENLPFELVKYLFSLYKLIQKNYQYQTETSSITPVKKLLVYSFLVNGELIEDVFDDTDPFRYSNVYNNIINLLFPSSIKKFSTSTHSPKDLEFMSSLVNTMSQKLDDKILNSEYYFQDQLNQETMDVCSFSIEEPILNYDYSKISQILQSIQFTPKDSKIFNMRKETEIFIREAESPVYKTFKKDMGFQPNLHEEFYENEERKPEDVDFITWMSVGGLRNYQVKQKPKRERRLKHLKEMKPVTKEGRKEIEKLYQKFQIEMS